MQAPCFQVQRLTASSENCAGSGVPPGDGGNVEGLNAAQFAAVNCSCTGGQAVCPCSNYNGGVINPNPYTCQDLRAFNPGQPLTIAPVNGQQPY
jgi:hypothetical protein